MKYPQLVHMPGDVERWLEKQFEARGFDGINCAKYIMNLLAQVNTSHQLECFPYNSLSFDKYGNKRCFQASCDRQSWDIDSFRRIGVVHYPMSTLKQECDIEKLVDELCVRLKEVENNGTALLDVSASFGNTLSQDDTPIICTDTVLSGNIYNANRTQPFPSHDSMWTRGLLHDSESVKNQNKMEDYFSSLFCDNPSDHFGFEFTRLKSEECQDNKESDRISFYNKQNLLAEDCTERLYERNTDVEKLIAKFDANIEGIWKPPEDLGKYGSLFADNIINNPCMQSESSLIWSFGSNGNDTLKNEKIEKPVQMENNDTTFSAWSKFSSPVITSSNFSMSAMLSGVNLTLSNVQKWSSMDGQNDGGNNFFNRKRHEGGFTEVIPKSSHFRQRKTLHAVIPRDRNRSNGDEEDLLTSTKTHFRPIRMEDMQANQTVAYADGTTFAISNELEKVTFTRSNSGILYLETDSDLETPRRYMEYKEREINTKLFDSESDLSLIGEFIPKFRVRQSNEKCCQTEDVVEDDQIVPSLNETDCDSDSYECDADEFFFPGDSELAENIVNKIEDEGKIGFRRIKSDCNYNDIYVMDNVNMLQKISDVGQCACSLGNSWLPPNNFGSRQEWNGIWCPQNVSDGCKCTADVLPMKDEYYRFREELTQEGEQLLSDLSCLQQLYSSSKWGDDESGTFSDVNEDENLNDVFHSSDFLNKFKSGGDWMSFWSCKSDMSSSNMDNNRNIEGKLMKTAEKNFNAKLSEIRDRPFVTEKIQEKKRRNSANQKVCNIHRFSFCGAVNTHPAVFEGSYLKEDVESVEKEIMNYELPRSLKRPLSF